MGNKNQEDIRMIRSTLRLILITMFLGFSFLWIIMPTNTYKLKWQPLIKAKVSNSTYFGSQGYTILLYTFPALLFACIGCVYIHLGKKVDSYDHDSHTKSGEKDKQDDRLAIWKQPMFVKGPLGIVSSIEIAFFAMFIALLVWSFSTYLHNSFAKITPASAAKNGEKLWESKLESSGLRLGLVGNIVLAVLFYPVTRGSSVLPLVGLTSEASVKYHIWLGHVIMTLFTAHGLCYLILWIATNQISRMIEWNKADISNLAGEIALVAGLLMWITAIPRIRRRMFELFFYTHYLYIVFVLFFFFHVGISYACMMLPGFYLFVLDRCLRFLQSRRNVRLIAARLLPCQALELNFSKNPGLKYHPTSTLFINVPSISKLQWHPFTITSSSNLEADRLSVMIKCEGSWTKKLYQTLSSSGSDRLQVSIEGPYGPVSTNFLKHDTLVMVSGGSGITPFISIIRDLIHAQKTRKSKTPKVLLVSAFKTTEDLSILDLIMPLDGTPEESDLASLDLKIEAYVTREKVASEKSAILMKWLKPLASDSPISAVLGPNSWLWLGAVIASSFAIFLILVAIITRFYIYPIDHNTNDVFSYSWRVALNVFAFFFALGLSLGFAVFVNKSRNAMEGKQILGLDGSPTVTPESTRHEAERELESLPLQSLAHSTTLHYGQRPDLKRILFECKGSSIGVLVSGPKNLRHDVAKICSSGLVENLHFESISFSW